jgi:nucleotide-binding universal stress UspA family protein
MVAEQLKQARRALPVTKLVVEGDPERRILEAAREKKIDLILLGHHDETGLEHFFIGRNIDRIVDHADCAVLIVRIHLTQKERDQEAVVRARSLRQSLM